MSNPVTLKRSLSLTMLVLYGLGTTIGAGIYALIGEIAGVAGYLAPFSFLVAALLAGVTALGFAELAARFPRAAGEALYVREGVGSTTLSTFTGLLVVLAGLVSAAAMINGFVGYLHQFMQTDRAVVIVVVTLTLGAAAAWGIAESVLIASLITLVEVAHETIDHGGRGDQAREHHQQTGASGQSSRANTFAYVERFTSGAWETCRQLGEAQGRDTGQQRSKKKGERREVPRNAGDLTDQSIDTGSYRSAETIQDQHGQRQTALQGNGIGHGLGKVRVRSIAAHITAAPGSCRAGKQRRRPACP